jgi:dephospho-CoA kinase
MLRVGLTGGLGSGKSTVGRFFAEFGAAVIDADEVGRRLMQPGHAVFDQIVERFEPAVVREDGTLDRRALAELAFNGGRLNELNRIVHPAVIAAQEEWMRGLFAADPNAIAIVESALIFEASREASQGPSSDEASHFGSVPGWRERFDRVILVTAPEELKIRRFVERSVGADPILAANDARRRLTAQIPDAEKVAFCDWVIDNSSGIQVTRAAVDRIYHELKAAAASSQCR